jgi:hypothetical protein
MTFTSTPTQSGADKDAKILRRVQRQLRKAFQRLKSWRKVAEERGVNHGYVSLVMQGNIPTSEKVRVALGFPAVMPSERRVRVRKITPLMGSEGWERVFFKRLIPRWRKRK